MVVSSFFVFAMVRRACINSVFVPSSFGALLALDSIAFVVFFLTIERKSDTSLNVSEITCPLKSASLRKRPNPIFSGMISSPALAAAFCDSVLTLRLKTES